MFYYNQRNYENITYPSSNHKNATIKSGGCGVCSTAIVVNNLAGKELFTVKSMRDLAIDSGARVAEGTDVNKLLKAIEKKYPKFTHKITNSEDELIKHLKAGGMAIANQGNKYNVFSNAGHFIACVGMSGNNIEVYDSDMYSGKYNTKTRQARIVKATKTGCIVSKAEIGKATADRAPNYYLVSYTKPAPSKNKEPKKTTEKKPSYKVGNVYTLQTDVKVRKGPGEIYDQKLRSSLSADGKKNAKVQLMATLKKDTDVTVKNIKSDALDNIWLEIPSGWVCAYLRDKKEILIK